MKKTNIRRNFVCALSLTLLLNGCSGSGSSDDNVNLSGKLGTGYVSSKANTRAGTSTSVSEVLAIPLLFNLLVGRNYMDSSITAPIKADNSFSCDLDKKKASDWIFLLIDPSKPIREKVSGYISIGNVNPSLKISLGGLGSVETIVKIPIGSASSSVYVGNVDQLNDEAQATGTVDFDESIEKLNQIAKTDNAFKILKNAYINYDGKNKNSLYNFLFSFIWDISSDSLSSIKDAFSPVNATIYKGYTFSLTLLADNPFFTYSGVANKDVTLALYPPEGTSVTDGTYTWSDSQPFANDDYPNVWSSNTSGWSNTAFGINPTDSLGQIMFGITPTALKGHIPAGYWSLKRDGSEVSVFDFAMMEPFYDTSFTKPNVYIPSIKATVDPVTNEVTKMEVIWYLYNNYTSSFEIVTDTSAVKKYQISIGAGGSVDNYIGDSELASLKRKIYFTGGTGSPVLTNITIFYSLIDGVIYWFNWN